MQVVRVRRMKRIADAAAACLPSAVAAEPITPRCSRCSPRLRVRARRRPGWAPLSCWAPGWGCSRDRLRRGRLRRLASRIARNESLSFPTGPASAVSWRQRIHRRRLDPIAMAQLHTLGERAAPQPWARDVQTRRARGDLGDGEGSVESNQATPAPAPRNAACANRGGAGHDQPRSSADR